MDDLYLSLGEKDGRFAAYLEGALIPKRDYKVLNLVWTHCNGKRSMVVDNGS